MVHLHLKLIPKKKTPKKASLMQRCEQVHSYDDDIHIEACEMWRHSLILVCTLHDMTCLFVFT